MCERDLYPVQYSCFESFPESLARHIVRRSTIDLHAYVSRGNLEQLVKLQCKPGKDVAVFRTQRAIFCSCTCILSIFTSKEFSHLNLSMSKISVQQMMYRTKRAYNRIIIGVLTFSIQRIYAQVDIVKTAF